MEGPHAAGDRRDAARGGHRRLHIYGSLSIVVCMKTTVEIADALLKEAKSVAAREHATLRELLEEGLRQVLKGRKRKLRKWNNGMGTR